MNHFKYGIEKKTILIKLDELKAEVLQLTEKLTDQIIVAQAEIKNINEANELMDILINENLAEYHKQETKDWIEIKETIFQNNSRREVLNKIIKLSEHTFNSSKHLVKEKESIINYGKKLYALLDKMDDTFLITEEKKDYRPITHSNILVENTVNREDILIKCISKPTLQPFGFKKEIIHFEYLNNSNELYFENETKIVVDNNFLNKIDFICNYLDLNNLEKYKEKEEWFFPISINLNLHDLNTTDVGFESYFFEFKLSILNHEIHREYSEFILNCPFRLRILIDFILSYNR
jgi:hypothetical protein